MMGTLVVKRIIFGWSLKFGDDPLQGDSSANSSVFWQLWNYVMRNNTTSRFRGNFKTCDFNTIRHFLSSSKVLIFYEEDPYCIAVWSDLHWNFLNYKHTLNVPAWTEFDKVTLKNKEQLKFFRIISVSSICQYFP